MENKYVIINGEFIPEEKAVLKISDLSIQRGYGVFDFFKIINHKFIFLDYHIERFFNSSSRLRLNPGIGKEELKELFTELHERHNIADAGIRITLTGGYSTDGYTPSQPNMIITHSPVNAEQMFEADPVSIITYNHQRQMPEVKTIDFLMAIWLQPMVKEQQAQDVLYHNNGWMRECPRANFFIVTKDDALVTPSENILKGITRMHILKHAKENNIQVEEREISLEELYNAREVFITSSTKNILPVNKIDGKLINSGKKGELTFRMREILNSSMK